jgi:RNA polymerase sigma factor (sigma-70 family)
VKTAVSRETVNAHRPPKRVRDVEVLRRVQTVDVVTTDSAAIDRPVMSDGPIASDGPVPSESPAHRTESFEAFYRREYPAVVALAYALCGRGNVAEDIAQEAFVVTQQRWARVSDYDKPGAYVRRVVANMAVSQRRRLAAEGRAMARMAVRVRLAVPDIEIPDPEFWRAVRALPRRQAQVLALYYLEDRPADEIGDILGCSASTVRVHLHRGRQTLEELLRERNQT